MFSIMTTFTVKTHRNKL